LELKEDPKHGAFCVVVDILLLPRYADVEDSPSAGALVKAGSDGKLNA